MIVTFANTRMMKRAYPLLFLVTALLCFLPGLTSAQFAIGLSGGGGLNENTGFRAAIPMEYGFRPSLSLFSGVAFVQRRNREIVRKLDAERDYFFTATDYLSVPFYLKLRLHWKPLSLYGLLGTEINYGLRMHANGLDDFRLFREPLAFDALRLQRWDIGLGIGAGFSADIHRQRKIFADIRYYLGITDIDRSAEAEIYNDGIYMTLGFLMPL